MFLHQLDRAISGRRVIGENITPKFNPADEVTMDIPFLIRLMEYSKEDAQTDMDLHVVAERLIKASQSGKKITMADYDKIVNRDTSAD